MISKKKNPRYELSGEIADSVFAPDDLVSIVVERNGCKYFWGIPYKNYREFEYLQDPIQDKDLLSLEAKLLDILVVKKYSIDFKQSIGVRNLDVIVRSSETEDKQLLHKLTSEFRKHDKYGDRDSIPGTNKDDE